MKRLEGHIAFITGAANGIGRATAIRMAREGARIIVADVQASGLASLASELNDLVVTSEADIFSEAGRAQAIGKGMEAFGAPDILINCVGGSTKLPKADMALADMTEDQWDAMIEFNIKGAFLCCRDLIPVMKQHGGGAIINLTSFTGRGVTAEAGVAYATAKAGLVGFTRRLAVEMAPFGIRCNAVAPGFVMTDRIRQQIWDKVGPEGQQTLLGRIPMRRFAEAEEIASVIAFLASPESSYMTGATLDCNGGIL
ncbi:SDR family oxidoreductase [Parapusillimonas sp. SGNA-6]|nr:SDR family oxidoreductase [Parapusillimonas sp. SGNA-6]